MNRVRSLVLSGLAGTALLVGATGAAPLALTQAPAASPVSSLQDLNGAADLRARFEADHDKVRIVLLLSPT